MSRLHVLPLTLFVFASVPAQAGGEPHAPFSCRLRATHAFLPELSTYSGYRWIECLVRLEETTIDGVWVNGGTCEAFDWWSGRTFVAGQTLNIPYVCMSPVRVAITANGARTEMRLR